jgi:hypothetical protein
VGYERATTYSSRDYIKAVLGLHIYGSALLKAFCDAKLFARRATITADALLAS